MMGDARSRWKYEMEDLVAVQSCKMMNGQNGASFVQTAGGNSFNFVALCVRPQNGFLCECLSCSRNKFSSYLSPPLGFVENYDANEKHLFIFERYDFYAQFVLTVWRKCNHAGPEWTGWEQHLMHQISLSSATGEAASHLPNRPISACFRLNLSTLHDKTSRG